ncbi:MAG: hypothetical protein Q4G51_01745 [Dermatophilus congolensis]|nr:hypothetical protein [Dermatophilus congolensis]
MAGNDGLSLGYRIWWGIRRAVLTVFGPAQLGEDDPIENLRREREAKIAEAQAKRRR